ncbi:unnamed protein product [Tuber melanosporum]|uniref:Large ribosomal subunit protein bL33m n=1 Tax=Tuber melanosporum (strain Mel28) TaxID=656061 RepID=D5GFR7_TUBMM|nr:uncharacterized protein GSTUM_00007028001 [Tuber melanosporum]CAZ83360.1 unnamed protein product [Tuber melanosporum]
MTPLHTLSHPANPIPMSSPPKNTPTLPTPSQISPFSRLSHLSPVPTHPLIPTLTPNSKNRVTFPLLLKSNQTSSNHFHPPIPIHLPSQKIMAKKAKSRNIVVRLISMAMTGYFKSFVRPRTHKPLSMIKYDPVVKRRVLFLEQKRGKNR